MNHPIHRALVTYSSSATGEIRVKIPSLLGANSEVSISYIGRSTPWSVPSIGEQIVVTSDDANLTNVFWVQTDPMVTPMVTSINGQTGDITDVVLSTSASNNLTGNLSVGGRFTAPNQPTFVARTTASTFTPATGTIVYDNAQLNVGNHYNTSTGRFTVPVAGVYVFTHILSARNTSTAGYEVAIGRNGFDATRIFTHGGSQQHSAISQHVMSLSVGDYIYASCYNPSSIVFSGSGDIFYDSGRNLVSGFMGYLLR